MTRKNSINYLLFTLPLAILLFVIMLPRTALFSGDPSGLSFGILMDMLITIPLVYLLIIWKTTVPKFSVLYVFLACLLLCGLAIPLEHQSLFKSIKNIALPAIELGILSGVAYKIFSLSKVLRNSGSAQVDFYDKLKLACSDIFPGRVGKMLASEMAVLYYLFARNKSEQYPQGTYSAYKTNGIQMTVGVLLGLIFVETFVVHLLLAESYPILAWILTILSLYAIIQIISILRSLKLRQSFIDYDKKLLELRYGFAASATIAFADIEKVESNRRSLPKSEDNATLSTFDILDTHNIILHLNKENTLQKMYGMEKKFTRIAIYLDEKEAFIKELEILKL